MLRHHLSLSWCLPFSCPYAPDEGAFPTVILCNDNLVELLSSSVESKQKLQKRISSNMKNSLGRSRRPPSLPYRLLRSGTLRSPPKRGREYTVFMRTLISSKVNVWLCDALEIGSRLRTRSGSGGVCDQSVAEGAVPSDGWHHQVA
jgi:hypothetical protein